MEVGNRVKIRKTGSFGTIVALEGTPARKAYVDVEPGADGGYIYLRLLVDGCIQTMALNIYSLDELITCMTYDELESNRNVRNCMMCMGYNAINKHLDEDYGKTVPCSY